MDFFLIRQLSFVLKIFLLKKYKYFPRLRVMPVLQLANFSL